MPASDNDAAARWHYLALGALGLTLACAPGVAWWQGVWGEDQAAVVQDADLFLRLGFSPEKVPTPERLLRNPGVAPEDLPDDPSDAAWGMGVHFAITSVSIRRYQTGHPDDLYGAEAEVRLKLVPRYRPREDPGPSSYEQAAEPLFGRRGVLRLRNFGPGHTGPSAREMWVNRLKGLDVNDGTVMEWYPESLTLQMPNGTERTWALNKPEYIRFFQGFAPQPAPKPDPP